MAWEEQGDRLLLRALAADDRRDADLDAADVGDRVERPGGAVERDPEIARTWTVLGGRERGGGGEERDDDGGVAHMPRIISYVGPAALYFIGTLRNSKLPPAGTTNSRRSGMTTKGTAGGISSASSIVSTRRSLPATV